MVYNDYLIPRPPELNPYPFTATLPAGTPGEHVQLFKIKPGAALDPAAASPFQYAVEVEAMFAGAGEDPDRIVTAFACVSAEVRRVVGYHTHREQTTAHWDGAALVVSIVRPDALGRVYTGFLVNKRLSHSTIITMLA